jgi:hypothetical protein
MDSFLRFVRRHATKQSFALLLAIEVVLLVCENTLDFPLSVPFMRRTTGHPYLDMCAFCSAQEIHSQLGDFGALGRKLQLGIMPTVDIAIPVTSWAFATVGLEVLLRPQAHSATRWLLLLPLAAMLLDFAENAGIIALVTAYPRREDLLATATGILSGVKMTAYAAEVFLLLGLGAAKLARRWTGPRNGEESAPSQASTPRATRPISP